MFPYSNFEAFWCVLDFGYRRISIDVVHLIAGEASSINRHT